MDTSRTEIEVDDSGVIRLPRTLRDAWHPVGRLEASVFGQQLIISPIPAETARDRQSSAASRIAALREWLASLPRHHQQSLPDHAVSRESMYD